MSFSFLSKSNPLVSKCKERKFLTPLAFSSLYSLLHHPVHVSDQYCFHKLLFEQTKLDSRLVEYSGSFVLPLHHHRLLPLGETH